MSHPSELGSLIHLGGGCCESPLLSPDARLHSCFPFSRSSCWVRSALLLAMPPARPRSYPPHWGHDSASRSLGCGLREAKAVLLCPLPANWEPVASWQHFQSDGLWLLNPSAPGDVSWLRASRVTNSPPANLTSLAMCLLAKQLPLG